MKPIISQAELDKFFEGCQTPDEKFSQLVRACLLAPPHPRTKNTSLDCQPPKRGRSSKEKGTSDK